MTEREMDLTVIGCPYCGRIEDDQRRCHRCDGTGSVFWVDGRSFPYTPEGEEDAKFAIRVMERRGQS